MPESLKERFDRKWEEVESGCWEWQGYVHKNGYARLSVDGEMLGAHRVSWALHYPRISIEGKMVLHHCDNPKCVNPTHLYRGDQGDNMRDMAVRGRGRNAPTPTPGNPSHNAKLNDEMVIEIRRVWNETTGGLAKAFPHIPSSTLRMVAGGKSWKHLPVLPAHPDRHQGGSWKK